jgi:hypothetical protein
MPERTRHTKSRSVRRGNPSPRAPKWTTALSKMADDEPTEDRSEPIYRELPLRRQRRASLTVHERNITRPPSPPRPTRWIPQVNPTVCTAAELSKPLERRKDAGRESCPRNVVGDAPLDGMPARQKSSHHGAITAAENVDRYHAADQLTRSDMS